MGVLLPPPAPARALQRRWNQKRTGGGAYLSAGGRRGATNFFTEMAHIEDIQEVGDGGIEEEGELAPQADTLLLNLMRAPGVVAALNKGHTLQASTNTLEFVDDAAYKCKHDLAISKQENCGSMRITVPFEERRGRLLKVRADGSLAELQADAPFYRGGRDADGNVLHADTMAHFGLLHTRPEATPANRGGFFPNATALTMQGQKKQNMKLADEEIKDGHAFCIVAVKFLAVGRDNGHRKVIGHPGKPPECVMCLSGDVVTAADMMAGVRRAWCSSALPKYLSGVMAEFRAEVPPATMPGWGNSTHFVESARMIEGMLDPNAGHQCDIFSEALVAVRLKRCSGLGTARNQGIHDRFQAAGFGSLPDRERVVSKHFFEFEVEIQTSKPVPKATMPWNVIHRGETAPFSVQRPVPPHTHRARIECYAYWEGLKELVAPQSEEKLLATLINWSIPKDPAIDRREMLLGTPMSVNCVYSSLGLPFTYAPSVLVAVPEAITLSRAQQVFYREYSKDRAGAALGMQLQQSSTALLQAETVKQALLDALAVAPFLETDGEFTKAEYTELQGTPAEVAAQGGVFEAFRKGSWTNIFENQGDEIPEAVPAWTETGLEVFDLSLLLADKVQTCHPALEYTYLQLLCRCSGDGAESFGRRMLCTKGLVAAFSPRAGTDDKTDKEKKSIAWEVCSLLAAVILFAAKEVFDTTELLRRFPILLPAGIRGKDHRDVVELARYLFLASGEKEEGTKLPLDWFSTCHPDNMKVRIMAMHMLVEGPDDGTYTHNLMAVRRMDTAAYNAYWGVVHGQLFELALVRVERPPADHVFLRYAAAEDNSLDVAAFKDLDAAQVFGEPKSFRGAFYNDVKSSKALTPKRQGMGGGKRPRKKRAEEDENEDEDEESGEEDDEESDGESEQSKEEEEVALPAAAGRGGRAPPAAAGRGGRAPPAAAAAPAGRGGRAPPAAAAAPAGRRVIREQESSDDSEDNRPLRPAAPPAPAVGAGGRALRPRRTEVQPPPRPAPTPAPRPAPAAGPAVGNKRKGMH